MGLPSDLAVKHVCEAPADFHPRFDAASRRYVYRLFCQPIRDPMRERYEWRVWPEVDGATLTEAAALFPGTHDFSAFGSPTTPKGATVRTVMHSEWHGFDGEWQFVVQADAFLYRMVRRMVFVQVAVAQGKCSLEQVRDVLSEQSMPLSRAVPAGGASRGIPAGLAPAHGLTLVEVTYGSKPG